MCNYKALYWGIALLLCGCQSHPPEIQTSEINYGYGLLYGVVSQEQDVDKILWIKKVSPELYDLIGEIASLSGGVTAELEAWEKQDPTLILSANGLPKVEVETRSKIADHKTFVLLGAWGPHFERDLILTQLEALNYIGYLMETLAAKDPQTSRHEFLKENSKAFLTLRDRIQSMLVVSDEPTTEETNPSQNNGPGDRALPNHHHR